MQEKFRPQNHAVPRWSLAPIHGITDLAWAITVLTNYPCWDRAFLEFLRIPSTPFSSHIISKTFNPPWLATFPQAEKVFTKISLQLLAAPHSQAIDFVPLLKDVPFNWIDLNLGCSTGMVKKHGGGAALLQDLATTQKIIHTLRQAWPHTFSLKIRPGINDLQLLPAILHLAAEEGVDVITVHGRLVRDNFTVAAKTEYIKLAAELSPIPIIANGDIQNIQDGQNILSSTHAQGVMLGRAGVGRPWLIQEEINHQATNASTYLTYTNVLTSAWAQAQLTDAQILARLKAISHWWPQLSPVQHAQLLHQTQLAKFIATLAAIT